jgi:hypothetical protein
MVHSKLQILVLPYGWDGAHLRAMTSGPGGSPVSPMMFYATATLIRSNVTGNTFREMRVDNSEPAHSTCFHGSTATKRLTFAPAYYGNGMERCEPQQIFRV